MIDGDSVQPASRQETFPWRAVGYYRHKGYSVVPAWVRRRRRRRRSTVSSYGVDVKKA